jgi:hypothetical protein
MSMNEDTIHELRARAECAEARVQELLNERQQLRRAIACALCSAQELIEELEDVCES